MHRYTGINERSVKYFDNQSMHALLKRQSEEIFLGHGHEFSCDVSSNIYVFSRFITGGMGWGGVGWGGVGLGWVGWGRVGWGMGKVG